MNAVSPFLTVHEAASLLRVPVSRIYDWTRQVGPEAIPCYRAGKRLVFDREEVLGWFRETQRVGRRFSLLARSRPMPAVRRWRASGRTPEGRRASNRVNAGVSGDGQGAVALTLPPEPTRAEGKADGD